MRSGKAEYCPGLMVVDAEGRYTFTAPIGRHEHKERSYPNVSNDGFDRDMTAAIRAARAAQFPPPDDDPASS